MAQFSFSQLSQRERRIALVTGLVVVAVVLYSGVINPFLTARADLSDQLETAQRSYHDHSLLVHSAPRMRKEWQGYLTSGLKNNATDAESQVQHAVIDWTRASGVKRLAINPDRGVKDSSDSHFMLMKFNLAGYGSQAQVARFAYCAEMAELPVRITEMKINNQGKDGADDLQFTMVLSTIYLAPPEKPEARP